jgi:hypothetical protein
MTPWLLLLVFVLLSAGIAAVGLSYYNAEKATHLEHQRSQLAAIADLKIDQIEAWRAERLGDASIIRQNTLVNAQIQEFLASGAGAPHRREIQAWLASLLQAYGYAEAILVAPDGSVRLASPPTAAWIGPTGQTMLDEVLQTGEAAFSGLHRAGPEAMVHLDLVIPLQEASVSRSSRAKCLAEATTIGPIPIRRFAGSPSAHWSWPAWHPEMQAGLAFGGTAARIGLSPAGGQLNSDPLACLSYGQAHV